MVMKQAPTLDLTGSELNWDWEHAEYRAEANRMAPWKYKVQHSLENAEPLSELIEAGQAAWAVEVRCPQTVYSETTMSGSLGQTTVMIPSGQTISPVDLWPGVVAVQDCMLRTDGLTSIWRTEREIPVSKGWWLARHIPLAINEARGSIIAFRPDKNLERGSLSIVADTGSGDFRFIVKLHPDQVVRIDDPVFQVTTLAAALAMLPYQEDMEIENDLVPGSRMGTDLLGKLENAGVPLWNTERDWDPMLAATELLALPLPEDGES
ncbi:MAG: hypothetical protein F4X19_14355 [Acidobacteria bacterium]|nr:hypothetical protein [Acidobacteriota bacterium]